jgi:hypothetical protein
VKEIRCINRIPFSSTREGDQMYQKDTFVEEKGILLIHLISFTCGRERYPFDTFDLLHVWKRKVIF